MLQTGDLVALAAIAPVNRCEIQGHGGQDLLDRFIRFLPPEAGPQYVVPLHDQPPGLLQLARLDLFRKGCHDLLDIDPGFLGPELMVEHAGLGRRKPVSGPDPRVSPGRTRSERLNRIGTGVEKYPLAGVSPLGHCFGIQTPAICQPDCSEAVLVHLNGQGTAGKHAGRAAQDGPQVEPDRPAGAEFGRARGKVEREGPRLAHPPENPAQARGHFRGAVAGEQRQAGGNFAGKPA